jgi:hypothetical protein
MTIKHFFCKLGPSRILHEGLFSLNIGFAVAYALYTYIDSTQGNALGQWVVSHLIEPFHVNENGLAGAKLELVVPMAGVALILFLMLLLLRLGVPVLSRVILDPIACLAALAAAPAFWIYAIIRVGPGLLWFYGYPAWPKESGFSFLVLEVSGIFVLLYAARKYRMPLWCSLALLLAHYTLWSWYMWPDILHRFYLISGFASAAIVCPCSGVAWLLYVNAVRDKDAVLQEGAS